MLHHLVSHGQDGRGFPGHRSTCSQAGHLPQGSRVPPGDHFLGLCPREHSDHATDLLVDRLAGPALGDHGVLIGEWLANGRRMPAKDTDGHVVIMEVVVAYKRFAEGYYVKNGTRYQRGEINRVRAQDHEAAVRHPGRCRFRPAVIFHAAGFGAMGPR